jgi:hypothetical protein
MGKAYSKFVASFIGAVAAVVWTLVDDGKVAGVAEWAALAGGIALAFNTWITPNLTAGAGKWAKQLGGVVIALSAALPPLWLDGHLDPTDKWALAFVVLGALGVVLVPAPGYVPATKPITE